MSPPFLGGRLLIASKLNKHCRMLKLSPLITASEENQPSEAQEGKVAIFPTKPKVSSQRHMVVSPVSSFSGHLLCASWTLLLCTSVCSSLHTVCNHWCTDTGCSGQTCNSLTTSEQKQEKLVVYLLTLSRMAFMYYLFFVLASNFYNMPTSFVIGVFEKELKEKVLDVMGAQSNKLQSHTQPVRLQTKMCDVHRDLTVRLYSCACM